MAVVKQTNIEAVKREIALKHFEMSELFIYGIVNGIAAVINGYDDEDSHWLKVDLFRNDTVDLDKCAALKDFTEFYFSDKELSVQEVYKRFDLRHQASITAVTVLVGPDGNMFGGSPRDEDDKDLVGLAVNSESGEIGKVKSFTRFGPNTKLIVELSPNIKLPENCVATLFLNYHGLGDKLVLGLDREAFKVFSLFELKHALRSCGNYPELLDTLYGKVMFVYSANNGIEGISYTCAEKEVAIAHGGTTIEAMLGSIGPVTHDVLCPDPVKNTWWAGTHKLNIHNIIAVN